jgi:hypothetical protein
MAQGDLYRLLRRVSTALGSDMDAKGKGSETYRDRINKYPHDLHINRDAIRDEILIQLNDFKFTDEVNRTAAEPIAQGLRRQFGSKTGLDREQSRVAIQAQASKEGFSAKQLKVIEEQADQFVADVLRLTKPGGKPPRGIKVQKVSGDNNNFVVRFTPVGRNANVYNVINISVFQPAKARLAKQLNQAGFKITGEREKIIFNIGHITGVSEVKAARSLNAVNTGISRIQAKYSDPVAQEAVDLIRLNMMSRFSKLGNPEFAKELLVRTASVKPESQAANLTDSDYEAALLRDVRSSLEKTIASMPNDWARQKSSDSILDLVTKDLIEAAASSLKSSKTAQFKAPKLGRKKTAPSKSPAIDIKIKKPKIQPKNLTLGDFNGLELPQANAIPRSTVRLATLIPIINARLPEQIRSNMGIGGRLVNRSGRFSESAQVVNIDDSSFTLSYTYMRNPYGKFEQQGDRDPRPLIEQSIREVATGLMTQRFMMRRL